ncbi:E3 ubiquitin-protein ligase At1g63170-like [Silene latifolia]|uniref:E3 ubiquitin-protein ligase At1g63170-like n=1 Tax=Silene latifolia TaxID=37657 RepID=UPI003D777EF4
MSTTEDAAVPLLSPPNERSIHSQSRRFSRRAGLRGAARFLRRASSQRMISEQSVRVRESAAAQIEERQSDWAYSTPIVILDLIWNTIFVMSAIVVMVLSNDEVTEVPLRFWLVGYGIQCVVHMWCVCVEYRRRRESSDGGRVGGGGGGSAGSGWGVGAGVGTSSGSGLGLNVNLGSNPGSYENLSSNSSSASVEGDFVEFVGERRQDEDNVSLAKHLESANTMFSFIWWIIGFYWVSSGGQMLSDDAPKLYWLTITFLAFDVFFVVICVVVACIIGIAVCCCLPCIIAILYAVADQEGATKEDIERLTKYKFRRLGEIEKPSGEIQESFGGIMTECDTDTPLEHHLSAEDAECVICLSAYEDGSDIRELPCRHHFHCTCIDKWLHMNATCPLCKYNILKNGSSDEV